MPFWQIASLPINQSFGRGVDETVEIASEILAETYTFSINKRISVISQGTNLLGEYSMSV
jgi:hypothetical protein